MATRKPQAAFTLVELLVVVIIVGVLAGVGIPLLTGQIDRARASEAEAGLGTIRSGLRAFFAENETYVGATMATVGINAGDLNGRYFDNDDFSIVTVSETAYCVEAVGGAGDHVAPRWDDVDGDGETGQIERRIDQDGTILHSVCPAAA